MGAIDRLQGTSLHHQISTLIKDGIAAGRFQPGDRLPTEEALVQAHGVSRVTVRRALKSLEQQGLIQRRAGSGTFVCEQARVLNMPMPLAEYLQQVAERRVLSRHVVQEFGLVSAPPDVCANLQLPPQAEVLRVVRLRLQSDMPQLHSTVYLPAELGRRFRRADFNRWMLSQLLEREGHRYAKIEMVTRARLASPAIAKLLHVAVGSALVDVQRVAYDERGWPLEFQVLLGPPDRFETHVTLKSEPFI